MSSMLIVLVSVLLASTATDPAAGVIVGMSGHVVVEGSTPTPQPASLGMRLAPSDVLVLDRGATASVYVKGGGVVKLHDATRFAIPKGELPREVSAKLKSGSIAQLESGLWVLNDPSGSLLVSPMRGDAGWEAGDAPLPLTPRYEALTETQATFAWTGGPPRARVVVAKKRDVVWRSAPEAPGSRLPSGASLNLVPGEVYTWWLEPETGGAPLTAGIPFRVAASDVLERTKALEVELKSLDAATAGYMRLAHYVGAGSWTEVLRLAGTLPDGDARARALAAATAGLRLDERGASALGKQLGTTQP